jgi:UDP-glucose 6-dehydrogenase
MKPDRIVLGTDNVRTGELIKELYAPFAREREKLIVMDVRSAEMTKYAANAMLATKISFMNEMAAICERVGADVTMIRKGIGSDHRIGYHFIYPGVGYGGSHNDPKRDRLRSPDRLSFYLSGCRVWGVLLPKGCESPYIHGQGGRL